VYYIKVLKVMTLDDPPADTYGRPAGDVTLPSGSALYGSLLALMILVVFLAWEPLGKASDQGVNQFRKIPAAATRAERTP
jgi:hypothetical protein